MNYVQTLNTLLKPSPRRAPLVLDLFAGCGGLALGFEGSMPFRVEFDIRGIGG